MMLSPHQAELEAKVWDWVNEYGESDQQQIAKVLGVSTWSIGRCVAKSRRLKQRQVRVIPGGTIKTKMITAIRNHCPTCGCLK